MNILKKGDLKENTVLISSSEEEVEFITQEQFEKSVIEIKEMWQKYFDDFVKRYNSKPSNVEALWNAYHEDFHGNEGNILFFLEYKEKDESEEETIVVRIYSRLCPLIKNENLDYEFSITTEVDRLSLDEEEYYENLEMVELSTFPFFEQDKMIQYFINESNNA